MVCFVGSFSYRICGTISALDSVVWSRLGVSSAQHCRFSGSFSIPLYLLRFLAPGANDRYVGIL